jgi:hypothetical protein
LHETQHLHDKYLPLLNKKFQRSYFSPKRNSWEIDLMFINYKDYNAGLKYEQILEVLGHIIQYGDSEKAFILTDNIKRFFASNGISYFFTSNHHTNRNRVVDRVIRTLRDMMDSVVGIEGNKALLHNNNM